MVSRQPDAGVPLCTSQLFLALRKVSRGRIGSATPDGMLFQPSEELSTGLLAALALLRQDGFVSVSAPSPANPDWYPALLTLRGTQLLASWSLHWVPSAVKTETRQVDEHAV